MPDSPFGSAGIDFNNHRLNGAATYFNEPDPALLPFGRFEPVNSGGDGGQTQYRFVPNADSRITEQGYVRGENGENLAQLYGNINLHDPSAVTHDSQFGDLTGAGNIQQPHDMWDRWLPVLVGAGILGPVMYAASGLAGAGGEAAAGAGDESAGLSMANPFGGAAGTGATGAAGSEFNPGLLSNIETPPITPMDTEGLNSAMRGLGYDWGGAPVTDLSVSRAPVTDLSTHAGIGDTLNNLTSGGGLLGGSGLSNLIRLVGAGTSLSGLLGGNHNNGGGNNGNNGDNTNNTNNGDKGGGGQGLNINAQRSPYTPNPYTARQIQNFSYAQPRGR